MPSPQLPQEPCCPASHILPQIFNNQAVDRVNIMILFFFLRGGGGGGGGGGGLVCLIVCFFFFVFCLFPSELPHVPCCPASHILPRIFYSKNQAVGRVNIMMGCFFIFCLFTSDVRNFTIPSVKLPRIPCCTSSNILPCIFMLQSSSEYCLHYDGVFFNSLSIRFFENSQKPVLHFRKCHVLLLHTFCPAFSVYTQAVDAVYTMIILIIFVLFICCFVLFFVLLLFFFLCLFSSNP